MCIGYLVDFPIWLLPKQHTWNCLGKTGMFHLKLLINFLSLSIAGQIDWHALRKFIGSTSPALKPSGSSGSSQVDPSGMLRVDTFLWWHVFWHAWWDPTIVMATYNNNDIIMVPYEDLPDGDKDVINKAIEKF